MPTTPDVEIKSPMNGDKFDAGKIIPVEVFVKNVAANKSYVGLVIVDFTKPTKPRQELISRVVCKKTARVFIGFRSFIPGKHTVNVAAWNRDEVPKHDDFTVQMQAVEIEVL